MLSEVSIAFMASTIWCWTSPKHILSKDRQKNRNRDWVGHFHWLTNSIEQVKIFAAIIGVCAYISDNFLWRSTGNRLLCAFGLRHNHKFGLFSYSRAIMTAVICCGRPLASDFCTYLSPRYPFRYFRNQSGALEPKEHSEYSSWRTWNGVVVWAVY